MAKQKPKPPTDATDPPELEPIEPYFIHTPQPVTTEKEAEFVIADVSGSWGTGVRAYCIMDNAQPGDPGYQSFDLDPDTVLTVVFEAPGGHHHAIFSFFQGDHTAAKAKLEYSWDCITPQPEPGPPTTGVPGADAAG